MFLLVFPSFTADRTLSREDNARDLGNLRIDTSLQDMGVPMPDGKWWGHRREKVPGHSYIDSR